MKILVIQQKMIGDVLMSSIICENIKKAYPTATIDYLVHEHTKAVVLNNPYIDKLVIYKSIYRKSIKNFLVFLKKLRGEKYNIVIDAYGKIESNLISLFSGAKKTISYHKWYTNWFYTDTVTRITEENNSAIKGRLVLLKPLNINTPIIKPTIYLTENEITSSKEFLQNHKINLSSPIFMISILGSSEKKTYPLTYMAKVINKIVSQTKGTIFFNYIPSQQRYVDTLYNLCEKETQKYIRTDVYAPSLRDFLGLLTFCDALIGNEGGAVNMAKALNIPTFSIYSPHISKNGWNFLSDEKNVGIHIYDYEPNLKNQKITNEDLYKKFIFKYFEKELDNFLDEIK